MTPWSPVHALVVAAACIAAFFAAGYALAAHIYDRLNGRTPCRT